MSSNTTLDGAFIAGVTAADVAVAMRRRINTEPLPAPPHADRLLAGLVAGAIVIGAMVTGSVVWSLRPQPVAQERSALVRIGDQWLVPPLALMGPTPEDVQHEAGLLRLRLAWPSLGPAKGAADIHVMIVPADQNFDPAAQLKTWSRFLTSAAWSNPGGLVVRNFRKGTPFEQDELYLALPDGRSFAALCPMQPAANPQNPVAAPAMPEEPCRATMRHGPFDISLRFPREALTNWQGLSTGVKALIDSLKR
jgi:hypothetical protein